MKNKVYGYVRISTAKQSIGRQIDNIKAKYPDACIIEEVFTGTTTDRPKWSKLEKCLKAGDTVVFDEVSRMSRNAKDGIFLYSELYQKGVNLIFLKEPYLNTDVFKTATERQLDLTIETGNKANDNLANGFLDLLNHYFLDVAQQQIELAFQTAEKEVEYLHRRTSEGVRKAQAEGKQVGRLAGSKIETKKSKQAKELIRKHSKDFGGSLTDPECIALTGLARNTYYKYKRELKTGEGH